MPLVDVDLEGDTRSPVRPPPKGFDVDEDMMSVD